MARITFPETILGWINLFKIVKPKVLALATPNTIDAYLTENTVVLANDATDVTAAETAHAAAGQKERDAEKHTEEGDKYFTALHSDHRQLCQNLKTVYRSDVHKLGDWGITVNNTSKIVYKTDPAEHAVEMNALITKHNLYPVGTSPLEGILSAQNIDLVQNALDITAMLTAFSNADTEHGESETQNELCSNKLNPVIEHLRGMGQAAIKMYAGNPHKAGDLGFTIDASHQPAKPRTFTLEGDAEMDLSKIDVGSFVSVEGDGSILISPKGSTEAKKGNHAVANKDHKALMTRGYGRSIVKNMDSKLKVTFTVFFNH